MKKIKISELPLFNNLKGLFTIGTDDQNRSVKVSLEFIETETKAAVKKAEDAATQADNARIQTNTATSLCNTATQKANTATTNAQTATTNANTATANANQATANAVTAKQNADTATEQANQAKQQALQAADNADEATMKAYDAITDCQGATDEARNETLRVHDAMAVIVPDSLTVIAPTRITIGNPKASVIATLTPKDALKNIIFLSDERALDIDIVTGRMTPLQVGKSRVRVIPTCNVALTKTLLIEVGNPTARLATKSAVRLSSDGAIRMN